MKGISKTDNPASTPLAKVSRHLDVLAHRVFVLEDAVGQSLAHSSDGLNQSRLTELQSLDFVRQSLEDLALLMHLVNTHVSSEAQAEIPAQQIAAKLKLKSTKVLISPELDNNHNESKAVSGDIDLF